ncbi:cupin domain-containing protein [Chitinophaga agrisoli]|uniref:Cupin domain-containing protein n=1 Tax=Chitinophaga agrisoli TaxID=2607653 RepID=A0A5B2VXQ6_9BACT|nr:cupin domain-containing protein [Chitinophaga agrisoli]KAA2243027.1 cupin domain-containing protein [Chitinophaga agrisoli]
MVSVTPLELIGQDERGANYIWESQRTGRFIMCFRKAGSSSGQHYHEGKSDYKNPEILFVLSGKAALHWCPLDEKEIRVITIEAPARVEVAINIWHQLIAVTDCTFIELNSLEDVQRDSVRIWREDFEKNFSL